MPIERADFNPLRIVPEDAILRSSFQGEVHEQSDEATASRP